MHDKRGYVGGKQFLFLFDLLLVIVILGSVGYYASNNRDDTYFKQQAYGRDVALLATEMLHNDAEISVTYQLEEDYEISFDEKYVIISYKQRDYKHPYIPFDKQTIVASHNPATNMVTLEKTTGEEET